MNVKTGPIVRDISRFLLIPAGMALLSLPVCAIAQEWFAVVPFLLTFLVSGGLSLLFYKLGCRSTDQSLPQVFMAVALGWGFISMMGALPFWLIAQSLGTAAVPTVSNFSQGLNALFEGVSGFTSAGLSMALRPSQLPACLQWWRSFMSWVGGVGVIVLAVALMEPTQNQYVLYKAEGRQSRIGLTVTQTVRRIWAIYIVYTSLAIVLFRAVGMTWWQALNHSMTAISTGGFTVTDGNMAAYGPAVHMAVSLVMIVGAISFSMHNQLIVKRNVSALWRDRQHFLLVGLIVVGTVVIALENYSFIRQPAWVDSAFQWVSALSTCGFNSRPLQFWSDRSKLLLCVAMLLGGAAGSTAGGLKLSRVAALIESVSWRFRRTTLSARQMTIRTVDGKKLRPEQASRQIEDAVALTMLWLLSIAMGVFVLIPFVPAEYTITDILFETTSAMGAAGLSVGISGPSLHWLGKCLLMMYMWMGRLEIIPVLMLLYVPFYRFQNRL